MLAKLIELVESCSDPHACGKALSFMFQYSISDQLEDIGVEQSQNDIMNEMRRISKGCLLRQINARRNVLVLIQSKLAY